MAGAASRRADVRITEKGTETLAKACGGLKDAVGGFKYRFGQVFWRDLILAVLHVYMTPLFIVIKLTTPFGTLGAEVQILSSQPIKTKMALSMAQRHFLFNKIYCIN